MYRGILLCCLALVLLLSHATVQAGEARDKLMAFFASEGNIRASFTQTVEGAAFDQPEESRGVLMMRRPGKFRWDYQTPYEQLIVADGTNLWIYDADLEQVIVKPLHEALGDTPALLLSGGSSVEDRFVITELDSTKNGLHWVQLLPRQSEAGFQELRLGFGKNNLEQMELADNFGQLTRLVFSDMQVGVRLPANSFTFMMIEGVDVVGQPAAIKLEPLKKP